ncbi:MAG: GTPase Era [Spirochaetes bacterium]|jgi:GTP-binding protein Era|nr:GTPase Era [Spirochaetota bacterium]
MPRTGFVAIVGRPSSGKSTLLNALCGHKISIVSPVPQTTRNKIRGILTDGRGQMVFLDTPGFHTSERKFNLRMRDLVTESLDDVEAVLYVSDATREPGPEESELVELLAGISAPVVCAINKVDDTRASPDLVVGFVRDHLPDAGIHRVSAVAGTGLEKLTSTLFEHLEEGELYYPEEFYTDQDPALRIAEVIREKAIAELKQEIPHALFVDIADMEMRAPPAGRGGGGGAGRGETTGSREAAQELWVRAFVTVERDSQKGIVIGRGGERIRRVRIDSEAELAEIFPYRVALDLRVKVQPKWRTNESVLNRLMR